MENFDDLFDFGQSKSNKKSDKKTKAEKHKQPIQHNIFAGIGQVQPQDQQFSNSMSANSILAQIQGYQGAPTNDEFIFDDIQLDVNFKHTPLPTIPNSGQNQLINMLGQPGLGFPEESKFEFKINENHYGVGPKQSEPAAVGEPTRIMSMSSDDEQHKSWFQRRIFDFTSFSPYFQTTSADVKSKLLDALWPFMPDNQPNELNPDNPTTHKRTMVKLRDEIYGPIWIMLTLVITLIILGHLATQLTIELDPKTIEAYKAALNDSYYANKSLQKIITVTFIVMSFFTIVPFSVYMVFRSNAQPSPEISMMRFFMLYAYSMAVFIPATGLYTLFLQFGRVRLCILLAACAMATYYQFKETIDVGKKYLTLDSYKKLSGCVVASTALFTLLLRSYFIGV